MRRRVTWVFIFTMVAVIVGAIHFVVHDARLTPQYRSSVSVANVAHEDRVHYGTVENLVPQTKEIGRKRIKVENGVAGVAQITVAKSAARLKVTPNTTQPPSITFATLINSSPAPSTFPTQLSMQHPLFQWSQLQAPPSLPWYQSDVKVKPKQIMQFRWVQKLWSFVTTVDRRFPIAIVASNSNYTDALLNWLIASVVKLKDPIKNILVLSLDSSLQNLLQMRRIDFLYVLPSTLANIKHSKHKAIKQVEVVRLTVMRILNHWGFDVVNYDSDTVILRNPQPIYDRYPGSDVIGSAGTFPNEIYMKWGVTVCMGVVMIRATNRTELLWNTFNSKDDQIAMNLGLDSFQIVWNERNSTSSPWNGRGSGNLTVTILPTNLVCRTQNCSKKHLHSYHIWHKGKQTHDVAKVWFLRHDWKKVSNNMTGSEWLKSISRSGVSRT